MNRLFWKPHPPSRCSLFLARALVTRAAALQACLAVNNNNNNNCHAYNVGFIFQPNTSTLRDNSAVMTT